MFNSSRLTLARMRRGLTGRQLAEQSGITPVHLSRIERGKNDNVEKATVEAISHALDYPAEFFYGSDATLPTTESASFRSLKSMSAKERNAALSAGAIAFMFSDWVMERFNLPDPDLPDLRYEKDPEAASMALRSYWKIGEQPIPDVIKLLEAKGVRVFSLSENTQNVDAFSCWRDGVPYVFLNTFKTAERSRFDALHELGHLVMHRHGKPQGRQLEREADTFASYCLIPKMDLMANLPSTNSLSSLVHAKRRWGVSVAALAYRLHKSHIISDWQYRSFCIQINKNNYNKTEPNGIDRERSVVWEKVFRELWKDRSTKDDVARSLSLPAEEIDNLVFNLVGLSKTTTATTHQTQGAPHLKLA